MRKITKVWKQKDGKKIRICDMGDSHLLNTIKMLERKAYFQSEVALSALFEAESALHGEMALSHIESEINSIVGNGIYYFLEETIYDDLRVEAERRNLQVSGG